MRAIKFSQTVFPAVLNTTTRCLCPGPNLTPRSSGDEQNCSDTEKLWTDDFNPATAQISSKATTQEHEPRLIFGRHYVFLLIHIF